ncbi:MAG: protein kinase family protein [Bacteroidetes bacterium]|nr:protein kinase family protein [Bacteroidota bacterium]
MSFNLVETKLYINDEEFTSHEIIEVVGKGVNGIVYRGRNINLDREEAIKIWNAFNPTDKRDKVRQGLNEALKLAKVNGKFSVQIYSANIHQSHVVATMEYINGVTLKKFLKDNSPTNIIYILYQYLEAIQETSHGETFHGDAHWENVLIYENKEDKYETYFEIKLCDFGTSFFSGKSYSHNRHWKIVGETILNSTKELKNYNTCVNQLNEWLNSQKDIQQEMMSGGKQYFPSLFIAPYRDFLELIAFENNVSLH